MDNGVFGYLVGPTGSGASGAITPPKGATIKQIIVHATTAGTLTIFGGPSIPIPAGVAIAFRYGHKLLVARNDTTLAGSQDIVATGTDSFYVDYFAPPGAPA